MSYLPQPGDRVIRCDCCGQEVVAVQRGRQIVILKRRHGREHQATVSLVPPDLVDTQVRRVASG